MNMQQVRIGLGQGRVIVIDSFGYEAGEGIAMGMEINGDYQELLEVEIPEDFDEKGECFVGVYGEGDVGGFSNEFYIPVCG